MSDPGAAASGYDIFLSYGTPDREWVRGLNAELQKLGLKRSVTGPLWEFLSPVLLEWKELYRMEV